jgi:MFS transporter, FHS family, Na+ dependent glucose transporter 1
MKQSEKHLVQRTLGYYLLFVCLGLGMGMTGPLLPSLANQTTSTLAQIGWIFLAGSLGFTLSTYLSGRLFDRWRGHPVLGGAQIVSALLLFCLPFVPELWLFLSIIFVKGIFDGMIGTGTNTLLVWSYGERSGPYMNALHFFFGLGAFISPLIIAQVLDFEGGYRWVYWLLAVFALLVGVFNLRMPDSPDPAKHQVHTENGKSLLPDWRFLLIGGLFLFFYVGSEIAYGNWLYTYALQLDLASAVGAAYLTSAFWLSFTTGRLVSIGLATRILPARLVLLALVGCLAAITPVLRFPGAVGLLWATSIALGFCLAPIWPTGFTLIGQSIKLTGRASGIILLGDSLGGMVLPWMVGQTLEQLGPGAMTWLVTASLVANLLAFLAILRLRLARKTASPVNASLTTQQGGL